MHPCEVVGEGVGEERVAGRTREADVRLVFHPVMATRWWTSRAAYTGAHRYNTIIIVAIGCDAVDCTVYIAKRWVGD